MLSGNGQNNGIRNSGNRYRAEGKGPSIHVADPESNVVEFKGPPGG
jgi:glyoxylase I family protein